MSKSAEDKTVIDMISWIDNSQPPKDCSFIEAVAIVARKVIELYKANLTAEPQLVTPEQNELQKLREMVSALGLKP